MPNRIITSYNNIKVQPFGIIGTIQQYLTNKRPLDSTSV